MESIDSLFGKAWQLFKQNVWSLALFIVTPLLISAILSGALDPAEGTTLEAILAVVDLILMTFAISGLVYYIDEVANSKSGNRPNLKEIWSIMVSKWYILLFVAILQSIFVILGFGLFFVVGLLFLVWFVFIPFAVVLEDENSWSALWRSREIVKGNWWAVFGRYMLALLTVFAATVSAFLPMMMFTMGGSVFSEGMVQLGNVANIATAWSAALGAIVPIFITPFVFAFYYFMYKDLK